MAFFKFRFPGQKDQDHTDSAAQSMESLRKRVKHRLMGSAVLVVLAVIGFPLVFDTQPRPLPLDMAIDIPDKAKTLPSTPPRPLKSEATHNGGSHKSSDLTPEPTQTASESSDPKSDHKGDGAKPAVTNPQSLGAKEGLSAKEVIVPTSVVATSAATSASNSSSLAPAQKPSATSDKTDSKAESKADSKVQIPTKSEPAKSEPNKPEPTKSDQIKSSSPSSATNLSSNSQSKDSNKESNKDGNKDNNKAASDSSSRFVVQVGAFSDDAKLKEVRDKLEKAGMHTYTSTIVVKDVKRTRVRIGPYASKDEANKWASKVKGLNLQANVIKLP